MPPATRRSLQVEAPKFIPSTLNSIARANPSDAGALTKGSNGARKEPKLRVVVATENRLLREALSRMLKKNGDIEVIGGAALEAVGQEDRSPGEAEILLLSSSSDLAQDLEAIRKVRSATPQVLILLIDVTGDETSFLQCIRAGVRGYLPRDASAEDVVAAVRALHAGQASCPGILCAALFRYLEREASSFPSATVRQKLGLTRREQQMIPLIAEGLTNKEIANRFCLSEQTVKNHVYRMKHKIGAGDRLDIVQVCRTQGFLI
jgi:DNA-binding NarL/FixJ family response regulator